MSSLVIIIRNFYQKAQQKKVNIQKKNPLKFKTVKWIAYQLITIVNIQEMTLSFVTAKFQQTLKDRLLIINILFQKVLKLIKVKNN
jgi:hypothetical protein